MNLIANAIGAAIVAAQTPAPIQDGPLTLDQAADLAARNAFAVRVQLSRIEQNRQRVAEARAGLGPRLGSTVTYTRFQEAITAQIGGSGTPPITIQPIDNTTATISFQLPIDIAGNIQRLVRANQGQLAASKESLRATQNDLRLNAKAAFFAVLRADANVRVAEEAVKNASERLEQAKLLLAGAQIAQVDVTRIETQLTQARNDLVAAKNNSQLARHAFNFALARPIETPVELVDVRDLPTPPSDAGELVQAAEKVRPEVASIRETVNALSNVRRAQEASLNPSLALGVNFQKNLNPGFGAQTQQTVGTLTMSLPIFDSGATRARVRQARQDEEQARINLEQTRLAVSQEVRDALTNLSNSRARLGNAEAQVKLAEELYRLAQIRQSAAEATYVEVVDSLTQLIAARNQVVAARYDYLLAYSQLQRAVGSDDVAAALQGQGTASPNVGDIR